MERVDNDKCFNFQCCGEANCVGKYLLKNKIISQDYFQKYAKNYCRKMYPICVGSDKAKLYRYAKDEKRMLNQREADALFDKYFDLINNN